MRRRLIPLAASLAACALLAACAPVTRVTLLPQSGGGAVHVQSGENMADLNHPYQTVDISSQSMKVNNTSARELERRLGSLLSAQPPAAQHYTLYFLTGKTELTPDSMRKLESVLNEVTNIPGGEIIVTGHTDTVGAAEANDALSLQRAYRLREDIIAKGFPATRIVAAGRGERELLEPTADGVDEPRNRRVEITVY